MRKYIFLCFFLFINISIQGYSQNYLKPFKALKNSSFEKSVKLFKSILLDNDKDVIANFGIALIYSNINYPKKDFIIAYRFILKSYDSVIKNKNIESPRKIRKYYPNICDSIINTYAVVDKSLYNYLVNSSDINLINAFLSEFYISSYYNQIVDIRNRVDFDQASRTNTVESYNEFIKRHPGASEVTEAINLKNQLEYEYAKQVDQVWKYNDYIKTHPDAKQNDSVIILGTLKSYDIAISRNSISSLDFFISHFPNAKQINQVIQTKIQRAYEIAEKTNTIESLQGFIFRNPNTLQTDHAIKKRDSLIFLTISNYSSDPSFKQFFSIYPFASYSIFNSISDHPKILKKQKDDYNLKVRDAFETAKAYDNVREYQHFIEDFPDAIEEVEYANRRINELMQIKK